MTRTIEDQSETRHCRSLAEKNGIHHAEGDPSFAARSASASLARPRGNLANVNLPSDFDYSATKEWGD